jgi:integrase/recombinase XerD
LEGTDTVETTKPTNLTAYNAKHSAQGHQNPLSGEDQQPTISGGYALCLDKFINSLRAVGRSEETVGQYRRGLKRLFRHLESRGRRVGLNLLTREDLELWLISMREEGLEGNTRRGYYMAARSFFNWALEEHEDGLKISPVAKIKAPAVEEKIIPIIPEADVQAMLDACRPEKTVWGYRDAAIIMVLYDSGLRQAELLGLGIEDVDFRQGTVLARGKGQKQRLVPLGGNALRALNRYLNKRKEADRGKPEWRRSPALWISHQGSGPLAKSGLFLMLRRRAQQAGVDVKKVHPHAWRHTSATRQSDAGVGEADLRTKFGWARGSRMAERYTKQTAVERAIQGHRKMAPADRLRL